MKTGNMQIVNARINNGDRVKDVITGFTGIVTCRLEYLNGCTRLQVSPEKLIEGKMAEPLYFDEPQMVLVKAGIHNGIRVTGGFQPNPPNRINDKR